MASIIRIKARKSRSSQRRSSLDVVDIFFGIFGQRPGWMNLMLIARNKVASLADLEVPTTLEILNMEKKDRYFVGEKIGPWPIFFLGSDELVAGRERLIPLSQVSQHVV